MATELDNLAIRLNAFNRRPWTASFLTADGVFRPVGSIIEDPVDAGISYRIIARIKIDKRAFAIVAVDSGPFDGEVIFLERMNVPGLYKVFAHGESAQYRSVGDVTIGDAFSPFFMYEHEDG